MTPANVAGVIAALTLVVLILTALGDMYSVFNEALFWLSAVSSSGAGLSCLILWSIGA